MKPFFISKAIIAVGLHLINICCSIANNDPKPLRLNLALVDPSSTIRIQGNRKYDLIILENLVNGYAYSVEIRNEVQLLPPLEIDASVRKSLGGLSVECNELKIAMNQLQDFQEDIDDLARDEKYLAALNNKLNVLIEMNKCDDAELTGIAAFWLNSSTKVIKEKMVIETGKVVTIIIKRDNLEWKFVFEGDSPGKWVTTYGFGFTTNALRSASYFTKQMPDTSVFQILKSRGPKAFDLSYVPAVFFTFFPSKRQSKCWNHSLTGGLGFDLVSPVLYFGYKGLYWHNIGFSAGLAFQQQNVLRDQFEVNDEVAMFMDTEQLHDKVYRPNTFISIHFRLDKNPFNKE